MALTTFIVLQGWFQYCHAPMGLCSSGDEYCACRDTALHDIQNIKKIIDDILIYAKSIPELLETVRKVFEQCCEHKITLSKDKVRMGNKITFAGYLLSDHGVRVNPDKLKAIQEFPEPENITKLRSFLGLANQLGHFIPDLAHVTAPLQTSLKQDVAWLWLPEHSAAMAKTKAALLKPAETYHFDPKKNSHLFTDASRLHGIGYALIQYDGDQPHLVQCGLKAVRHWVKLCRNRIGMPCNHLGHSEMPDLSGRFHLHLLLQPQASQANFWEEKLGQLRRIKSAPTHSKGVLIHIPILLCAGKRAPNCWCPITSSGLQTRLKRGHNQKLCVHTLTEHPPYQRHRTCSNTGSGVSKNCVSLWKWCHIKDTTAHAPCLSTHLSMALNLKRWRSAPSWRTANPHSCWQVTGGFATPPYGACRHCKDQAECVAVLLLAQHKSSNLHIGRLMQRMPAVLTKHSYRPTNLIQHVMANGSCLSWSISTCRETLHRNGQPLFGLPICPPFDTARH